LNFLEIPSLLASPGFVINLSFLCSGQMSEMHQAIQRWREMVERLQEEARPKELETNRLLTKVKSLEEEGKLVSPLSNLRQILEIMRVCVL